MRFALRVKKTIDKHRMLARGDAVLAAVSGGPDSIALLHLLWKLRDELKIRLEVAHVEHGIRGAESNADARFVAEIAARLGLPFHLKRLELGKFKRARGNLEALAREARYRFFAEVAAARGIERVATGHTRDDQAETLLMRLLRGSGRTGLGAIAPVRKLERGHEIVVVRPLIEISRNEIEAYLAAEKLSCRIDRTNSDTGLLRNWVRLELLPMIRGRTGAGLDLRLARTAEALRDEEDYLDAAARAVFTNARRDGDLDVSALRAQPKALRRRVVRLWLEQHLSLSGVDFAHVEAILRLIAAGPPQGRIAVPRGHEVARRYDRLALAAKSRPRRAARYEYAYTAGAALPVPEAGMLIESERAAPPVARPRDAFEAVFDLQSLPAKLAVRNFRAGDRFQPIGMRGRRKIKELFSEKKVPLAARATLPLLVAEDEILWIPGCGRSALAPVGPRTREILRVRVAPLAAAALRAGESSAAAP